jgi:hypothetical protein
MKSRLGSAIVALGAFAAISIVSTGAHAQQQGGVMVTPAPGQPVMVTPMAPAGPAPAGPGAVPTVPYRSTVGEQRTEYIHPNVPLLTTGGLTFLAAYVPSFVVAATSDHDDDKWLYLPIAGPFVDLATRGCSNNIQTGTCGTTAWERGALIASGSVQAVGAAMIVGSFFSNTRRLTSTTGEVDNKPRLLSVTPATIGSGAPGVLAVGTF